MKVYVLAGATFLIALLLEILPLPNWMLWLRPAWVTLVLMYWVLQFPYRIGVTIAFLLGFVMDLLTGGLLGEHSLAFVLIAYFMARFYPRIRLFPWWQQTIMVLFWICLYENFLFWIRGILGGTEFDFFYLLPAITSALVWPLIYIFLNACCAHYRIRE